MPKNNCTIRFATVYYVTREYYFYRQALSLSTCVFNIVILHIQIVCNHHSTLIYINKDEDTIFESKMPDLLHIMDNNIINCWLTWHCDTIQIGEIRDTKLQKPFFVFKDPNPRARIIGFVKFINHDHDVVVDSMFLYLFY